MNIQIFGTKKSNDTKKAQRYFKERRIPFQFVDLREKEMSPGELKSVMQAVGGLEQLLDPKAKDQEALLLIRYSPEDLRILPGGVEVLGNGVAGERFVHLIFIVFL
ncbi:arsenate reductase family protein [Eubacterium pyruvativorans]|uniref:arsenate reductase family protein n=1 Tax=Eubacterium pyruvativorans TaxID=155865 RepID=UPI0023F3E61F|nr:ArsC family transcriptional regulator [Eubacterium pyruvativorans]